MNTIKTCEATPLQLNWLVAKCNGELCQVWGLGSCRFNGVKIDLNKNAGTYKLFVLKDPHFEEVYKSCEDYPLGRNQEIWSPSTNWSQGGPIIERAEIDLFTEKGTPESWVASVSRYQNGERLTGWRIHMYGPTPLIAAMRCYVASKLGDEVEIPEVLK